MPAHLQSLHLGKDGVVRGEHGGGERVGGGDVAHHDSSRGESGPHRLQEGPRGEGPGDPALREGVQDDQVPGPRGSILDEGPPIPHVHLYGGVGGEAEVRRRHLHHQGIDLHHVDPGVGQDGPGIHGHGPPTQPHEQDPGIGRDQGQPHHPHPGVLQLQLQRAPGDEGALPVPAPPEVEGPESVPPLHHPDRPEIPLPLEEHGGAVQEEAPPQEEESQEEDHDSSQPPSAAGGRVPGGQGFGPPPLLGGGVPHGRRASGRVGGPPSRRTIPIDNPRLHDVPVRMTRVSCSGPPGPSGACVKRSIPGPGTSAQARRIHVQEESQ